MACLKHLLLLIAGALGLAAAPAAAQEKAKLDAAWNSLTLHEDPNSAVLNELRIVGRLHIDHYQVDADQGEADDLLFRRFRLGARARLFTNLETRVEVELDPEGDGSWYSRITDAYLAWKLGDRASLTVGKQSVRFTLDGSTSSNELLTIDRSNVANNLWFTEEYVPGVSMGGRSGPWVYNAGLYSGGRAGSEFGDFEGGHFWLGSLGRDFAKALRTKRALVRADYVYNEPNPNSSFTRPFEHIGALVFILDADRWGFSGDVVAGDGFLGQSDAFGATALPWIGITDRLQLTGRYTYVESDGANGVRLPRYENVVTSGRGDRYRELYLGLNYYLYGHRLKAQTGLAYATMRDRANDSGAYKGLSWATGLRVSW